MDFNGVDTFSDCSLYYEHDQMNQCLLTSNATLCVYSWFSSRHSWCHRILLLEDLWPIKSLNKGGEIQMWDDRCSVVRIERILSRWKMTGSSLVRKMKRNGTEEDGGKESLSGVWGGDRGKRKSWRENRGGKQIGVQHSRCPAEALGAQRPDGSQNSLMMLHWPKCLMKIGCSNWQCFSDNILDSPKKLLLSFKYQLEVESFKNYTPC